MSLFNTNERNRDDLRDTLREFRGELHPVRGRELNPRVAWMDTDKQELGGETGRMNRKHALSMKPVYYP
jgi:hypothetical protein